MVGWPGRCPKVRHQRSTGFCCIQRKRLPYGGQTYLEVALRPRLKYKLDKHKRKGQDGVCRTRVNNAHAALQCTSNKRAGAGPLAQTRRWG